jgi:hypothetical protein
MNLQKQAHIQHTRFITVTTLIPGTALISMAEKSIKKCEFMAEVI